VEELEAEPSPQGGERVMMKMHVERGFSLPPSEFFRKVLDHYGLQPHNLSPNSILCLRNYVAICEGYLGIKRRLYLFNYY
jgi:hypothetical protein